MDTTTQRQSNEDAEREAREAKAAEEREAKRQEQIRRNQAAIQMLEEWMQEDPQEEPEEVREMWDLIQRSLDERQLTLRVPDLGFDEEPPDAITAEREMHEPMAPNRAESRKPDARSNRKQIKRCSIS